MNGKEGNTIRNKTERKVNQLNDYSINHVYFCSNFRLEFFAKGKSS